MIKANQKHVETIRQQSYNDFAREMRAQGVHLTFDQFDEIGDLGRDWLRRRLGLSLRAADDGVYFVVE